MTDLRMDAFANLLAVGVGVAEEETLAVPLGVAALQR